MIRFIAITAILVGSIAVGGLAETKSTAPFKAPTYTILRAGMPIAVDGKLEEPAWFAAPDVGPFVFPWWKRGKKEQSVAKLLYDDENLYVACVCEDAHIAARHKQRDGKIPEDDCFEIMFAPNPDRPDVYFNVEWNVIGGILDNFRPHGPDKPRAPKWDAADLRVAGTYVGTLNDDSDQDSYWITEVALPFKNFIAFAKHSPPKPGDRWNVNFNRHGGPTNPQYSQWSPGDTPMPKFHTPHRFGKVTFSDQISPFGRGRLNSE